MRARGEPGAPTGVPTRWAEDRAASRRLIGTATSSPELHRALLEMLTTLVARSPLFAELRSRGEAEDLVQDALVTVTRRMRRGDIDDPFAFANRVVHNLARRAYVRARPEDASLPEVLEQAGPAIDVGAVVEQRFELAEVLEMVRTVGGVVERLPADDLELVRAELCRTDQSALAGRMGLSRTTFYRRKRDALCGFVRAVADHAGTRPCPDRMESLLAAAGGSGFAGATRAREHAADCSQCADTLRHLAAARHGMAVLTPLPLAVTPTRESVGERLAAFIDWLRGLALRAPDPAVVLPSSKSAAAAVVAACVGIGGTTYCVTGGPVHDALIRDGGRTVHVVSVRPRAARPRVVTPAPVVVFTTASASHRSGNAARVVPVKKPRVRHVRRKPKKRKREFTAPVQREFTPPPTPAPATEFNAPAAPAGSPKQEFGGTSDAEFG